MTVDINIYAEIRESDSWKCCYPIESFEQNEMPFSDLKRVYENDMMGGDYELFQILLNAHRFKEHEATLVAQPRGLPHDLSPELREVVGCREGYGMECYHSSWLLLEEVLQLPWEECGAIAYEDSNAPCYGTFDDSYVLNKKGRRGPSSGVGDVTGNWPRSMIVVRVVSFLRWVSFASFRGKGTDTAIPSLDYSDQKSEAITKMVRGYSPALCCQLFLQRTVPLLKSFGQPDQIRIVFWA